MNGRPPHDAPDEALVEEARRNPQGAAGRAAASELFRRYQRRIYLWCYRYVRDPERALDLAQEVMVNAWRALPTFQGRSRFAVWLFVISRNRCLNAVTAPALLGDEDLAPDQLPAAGSDPAEQLAQLQDEEAVRRSMIRHLDEQEREALWLRCFERMPVESITRAMRLSSASGARGLLQRARRKLRAALEAQSDAEP
jgi:RNA polymerase sigma-70 factor (ECF subfamily)